MAVPDRQGPKQRQRPHRSAAAGRTPARPPKENRARDRGRDLARRPKKYYVAGRLQESELTPERLAQPRRPRRPTVAVGRAPAARPTARVKDVMVIDVVAIDGGATLRDAARVMRDANLGMLPVLEAGRLRGIVTDRDLVVRGIAEGLDPDGVAVHECLTDQVIVAHPEWSADRAMETMAAEKVGRLPVLDDRGQLVGVVTLSSLVLRGPDEEEALETAKEVSRRSARRPSAA